MGAVHAVHVRNCAVFLGWQMWLHCAASGSESEGHCNGPVFASTQSAICQSAVL